jgi:hypothetical protein
MENRTPRQQQQTLFLLSAIAGGGGIYFHTENLLYLSVLLALVGAFSLTLSHWIDFLWMKLAWLLGAIIPRILLSVIFYLMLTPLAILSRLFGEKDPLFLKKQSGSVFRTRVGGVEKASFEKPW